jgi:acetylornithine deacetylase/succinyl-diaminopimelate desuccinylase-like protein
MILLLLAATATPQDDPLSRVRDWTRRNELAVLREFSELLAIPNVASDAPSIERNARHVAALFEKRGLHASLLDGGDGPPAVYAELRVPGARRTLGVYVHYDGQPVEPEKWKSDPWRPVLRDGLLEAGGRERPLEPPFGPEWRLYARSASDDKAPIVGWLAALDALRAAGLQPRVNLKLLLEGEEEAGSRHLPELMRRESRRLSADLWLLCDGPVHQSRRAQVYFGARGVMGLELTVYGPLRPLHSGHYGNWAPNPAAMLARLVASLWDDDGRIRVAGFYDDVRVPSAAERAASERLPDADAALLESLALGRSAAGVRLAKSVLQPALNVRGLASGAVAERAQNAIPSEARASLDLRLVPDQRPERVRAQLEEHLRREGYTVVHEAPDAVTRRAHPRLARLEWDPGYPAARTPLELPAARRVLRAVAAAMGEPALVVPTLGGSIPMYLFGDRLGTPVIGLPIANHDNNQHAADENIRLQNLWDGIAVYAALLLESGADGEPDE